MSDETTVATAAESKDATDWHPTRNPQGIPFRVPTRPELIKYIGDYVEAYRSEQHDRGLSKVIKAEVLQRASQKMSTAVDYLYGRLAVLESLRAAPERDAE